ncbi:MAG: DUF5317 domain-containing protein [Firmicutes bacterium]|jgi:hypothetical protein|nr:DUF5317 domain-containing protein [Bacillota bacterium]HPU00793.1 DUF5317 family protein [Bacillota bacterium]
MLIEAILLGLVIGWLRRGQLRHLAGVKLAGWALVLLALAIKLAIMIDFNLGWSLFAPAAPYLHLISYLPLLAFVFLNRSQWGMILMGLGLLLNLIVIAANGGFMPVNPAFLTPPMQEGLLSGTASPLHTVLTDESLFPLLGDQIPIPYRVDKVISIGDLLLGLGIALFIQYYMISQPAAEK